MSESPDELIAEWKRLEKESVEIAIRPHRIMAVAGIADDYEVSRIESTGHWKGGVWYPNSEHPHIKQTALHQCSKIWPEQSRIDERMKQIRILAISQGIQLPEAEAEHEKKPPSEWPIFAHWDTIFPLLIRALGGDSPAASDRGVQSNIEELRINTKPMPTGIRADTKVFCYDGNQWVFVFGGKEVVYRKTYVGFRHIHRLLKHPDREFSPEELEMRPLPPSWEVDTAKLTESEKMDLIQLLAGGDNAQPLLLAKLQNNPTLDARYRREVQEAIEELEEQKTTEREPERLVAIGQNLSALRSVLNNETTREDPVSLTRSQKAEGSGLRAR